METTVVIPTQTVPMKRGRTDVFVKLDLLEMEPAVMVCLFYHLLI